MLQAGVFAREAVRLFLYLHSVVSGLCANNRQTGKSFIFWSFVLWKYALSTFPKLTLASIYVDRKRGGPPKTAKRLWFNWGTGQLPQIAIFPQPYKTCNNVNVRQVIQHPQNLQELKRFSRWKAEPSYSSYRMFPSFNKAQIWCCFR